MPAGLPILLAAVGVALIAAGVYVIAGAEDARYDNTPIDTPEQLAVYAVMAGAMLIVLGMAASYVIPA